MNQDELKEKLLELFANHALAEVEANDGRLLETHLGRKIEELSKIPGYNEEFTRLEECKQALESSVASAEGNQTLEVRNCLTLLSDAKKDAYDFDFQALGHLI